MANENPIPLINKVFGDVCKIPVEWEGKIPKGPWKWIEGEDGKKVLLTREKLKDYLEDISTGKYNVAIRTGEFSDGLCVLDFDAWDNLELFLETNPKLAETTQTKGSRGGAIWVRIKGEYPESFTFKESRDGPTTYEWKANDCLQTVWGKHPKGMMYRFIKEVKPVEVEFGEINWPEEWQKPPRKATQEEVDLEEMYGQPFFYGGGNPPMINGFNERLHAALNATENDLKFNYAENDFSQYVKARGLWLPRAEVEVREMISRRMRRFAIDEKRPEIIKLITAKIINPIVNMMKGIDGVFERNMFNPEGRAPFIHCANGMVEFTEDGVDLKEFHRDYHSRNQCPLAFNENAKCERFLNEFLYPAVGEENALMIRMWMGMLLTSRNPYEKAMIFMGHGNDFKSTLYRIIMKIYGEENCGTVNPQHLSESRFGVGQLKGKRFQAIPDADPDVFDSDGASIIKSLIGNDPHWSDVKFGKEKVAVTAGFNFLLMTNGWPIFRIIEDAKAWTRRLLAVWFKSHEGSRPGIDEMLIREEGEGILFWAIVGYLMLLEASKDGQGFPMTKGQMESVERIIGQSDSFRKFIAEELEAGEGNLSVDEIHDEYYEYCTKLGWRSMKRSKTSRALMDLMWDFWKSPESHNLERFQKKNIRGYRGVAFKNREEDHGFED